VTAKSLAEVAVAPAAVTESRPVVAPAGTVTVSVAGVPWKATRLAPAVGAKWLPAMVTEVPTGPEVGVKPVMAKAVGSGSETTVKSAAEVAVFPPTVTVILPVVAPGGTVRVSDEGEAAVTGAAVPARATRFSAATAAK